MEHERAGPGRSEGEREGMERAIWGGGLLLEQDTADGTYLAAMIAPRVQQHCRGVTESCGRAMDVRSGRLQYKV